MKQKELESEELKSEELNLSEMKEIVGGFDGPGCGSTLGHCTGPGSGCGIFNGMCELERELKPDQEEILPQ